MIFTLQSSGLAGLQYGTNKGASQAGSQAGSAFGSTRPIMASEFVSHDLKPSKTSQQVKSSGFFHLYFMASINIQAGGMTNLQTGTNTGASQAGSTAFGSSRPINPSEFVDHDLKPSNAKHQVLLLPGGFREGLLELEQALSKSRISSILK